MATVIAEIAQAHDGSLGTAHAYVDAVAGAGADAIKFQTHIASAESTRREPWRVRFSPQDEDRYDYWRRMEFTESQWEGLREHAKEKGLGFISSAFSVEAVDLLERIGGVDAWKVASGEVGNELLLDRILGTTTPVLISSGMSSLSEVDAAVERAERAGADYTVLQCTSCYPTLPEKVGLNMLAVFRDRYDCPVGLSDHSGTIYPSLAAITLGAAVIEVHVVLSREAFGPDVSSSITTGELAQLAAGARFLERVLDNPVEKDDLALELEPMRALFTKSLVLRRALRAGDELTEADLVAKKPGGGVPPTRLAAVVGRRVTRDLGPDDAIREEDLT